MRKSGSAQLPVWIMKNVTVALSSTAASTRRVGEMPLVSSVSAKISAEQIRNSTITPK